MFKLYHTKWAIFLCLGLIIIGALPKLGTPGTNHGVAFLFYMFFVFFYVAVSWTVHGLFIMKRIGNFKPLSRSIISNLFGTFFTCLLFVGVSFVPDHIKAFLINSHQSNGLLNLFILISQAFFISFFIYVIIYQIHTNEMFQRSKIENEILKQVQLRAQLQSLQQQVSPHFLFNSLSTLRTIAPDVNTKTYVEQLAYVYRYLLSFNDNPLTTIKEEISFMESYLYILKERYEDDLEVIVDVSETFHARSIPPLALQILVENAIKHNIISPEKPLKIRIYTELPESLIIENIYQPKKIPDKGCGKGLQNVRERFKLIAGKEIYVSQENDLYKVELPIL
jgi:two-component system LytT family sensor kinase